MTVLEDKFNKAIDDRKFSILEITGFAKEPRLALIAGAAIGYQLALDFCKEQFDKYDNVMIQETSS